MHFSLTPQRRFFGHSAAFGPRVSKSTFGGTGVSDCTVPGNHLSVLTSPSEAAILQGNNRLSVAEQAVNAK